MAQSPSEWALRFKKVQKSSLSTLECSPLILSMEWPSPSYSVLVNLCISSVVHFIDNHPNCVTTSAISPYCLPQLNSSAYNMDCFFVNEFPLVSHSMHLRDIWQTGNTGEYSLEPGINSCSIHHNLIERFSGRFYL